MIHLLHDGEGIFHCTTGLLKPYEPTIWVEVVTTGAVVTKEEC